MEQSVFDIAVIGAGPGGSVAAWSAAKAGKRVVLIDRKAEPGYPVRCGEGIGIKGLKMSMEPKPEWIKSTITRAAMVSPSGIRIEIGNMDESYVLDRKKMDLDLALRAKNAGAHLLTNTPVLEVTRKSINSYECVTPNGPITAKCVILAEGIESRLGRSFGWNTTLDLHDLETCAFARVFSPFVEQQICVFYTGDKVAPGGYAWVFPKGPGEANVGLGIIGSRSSAGSAQDLLKKFIDQEFPGARMGETHCGGVPVGKWIRPLAKDGVMLVGDAAHQVNCLSGAGIGYAMYAGRIAGEAAAKACISENEVNYKVLGEYERQWSKSFGKNQERSHALKEFLRKTDDQFLDKIAQSLAKENPDNINYLRVFMRAFSKKPLLLFKVLKIFS